jgi:hypothetical protein
MFATIKRSYYLFRGSLHVLNLDRELLLFPLISGILTMLVMATFVLPIIYALTALNEMNPMDGITEGVGYVILFFFYLVTYAITYYFNTAVVSCAIYRMKGGDPDVKGGFRAASSRFKEILGWALVSATVGLLLKFIQDKSKGLGKFIVGLIGISWSVATYLVIPVIVMERVGPLDALKESGRLVKKTWGEQVAGNIGFGFFFFLILLPLFIIIPMFVVVESQVALIIGIAVIVIYIALVSLVQSTLTAIYQAALYLYAKEDFVPEGYSRSLLRDSLAKD